MSTPNRMARRTHVVIALALLMLVGVAGYSMGRDMALRDNARAMSSR
ncbi:hypothetical protein [Cognatilysobacter terrigena]|nr:hypothetical protein [Lysobacter terrigena]